MRLRKAAVVGAGKTGIATALFLTRKNYEVILNDINEIPRPNILPNKVKFITGTHNREIFDEVEFIVLSPGIDKKQFPVKDIKIIGDIELFYKYNKAKIIGITGTNGKTTTTTLIGEILKRKYKVFVGGNIGTPVLEAFEQQIDYDWAVLELSSFQLELIDKFYADIVVILNITPDHLNRYNSFKEYKIAKLNILKNQSLEQIVILNFDDENLKDISLKTKNVFYFSLTKELNQGAFFYDNHLVFKIFAETYKIPISEIKLKGKHFYEDIMAAGIVSLLCGVNFKDIKEVIKNFKGLEHRMEFVGEIGGIKFYNDSKSTTVDSTYKALMSFNEPIILLIGGVHKGESYKKLGGFKNLKKIICYGEAKDLIFNDLKWLGDNKICKVDNLEQAFNNAIKFAQKGDVILLSPACSSFDEFKNYEERGKNFKCMISQLQKKI